MEREDGAKEGEHNAQEIGLCSSIRQHHKEVLREYCSLCDVADYQMCGRKQEKMLAPGTR